MLEDGVTRALIKDFKPKRDGAIKGIKIELEEVTLEHQDINRDLDVLSGVSTGVREGYL